MTDPASTVSLPAAGAPSAPAFRTIFDDHFGYVCASARRLGVPPPDVEDVAHDVFVAVHQRLSTYDPSRPLRPWLFAFTVRVSLAARRRLAQRRTSELVADVRDPAPLADEHLVSRQRADLLGRALEALSDEQRAVFILHELDATSVPEIARSLEIPLNTAYSRLRLARENVERALREATIAPRPPVREAVSQGRLP